MQFDAQSVIIYRQFARGADSLHVAGGFDRRLGGGADGEVFKIVRDNHGVQTYSALKVLRTGSPEDCALPPMNAGPDNPGAGGNGSAGDNIPEVFMNEIRIMEALRGAPNIVLIEDFYFQKGVEMSSLYVRMELLTSFEDVMSAHLRNGTQFTIPEVLKIGKDHPQLRVVDDQIGTPTYTLDLAVLLVSMIESGRYGFYHATNEGGYISWYDFASEIFRQAAEAGHPEYGTDHLTVTPVSTEEYGVSKAKRPFNSRLDKSKLTDNGFALLPDWKDALKRYLDEIQI